MCNQHIRKMQLEVNNIKNLSTKHRGITAQIVM